jgi:hypothetical protein
MMPPEQNAANMLTPEQRATTPSFVALCPTCGLMIACSVDRPEYAKVNAKSVSSWIRRGLRIIKRTVAEVRSDPWCECKRDKPARKKAPLT